MDQVNFWLNGVADEVEAAHPEGEIVISSGVSPSGKYHLGTLREIMTAEGVARELRLRGRMARHLHISDDHDVFRKVPADMPAEYEQYLGRPLCDLPAPDGSERSYADYYLADLEVLSTGLNLEMEVIRANERYRDGYFKPAIERSLEKIEDVKRILTEVSGRKLDTQWSPIQVIEDGYLKTRPFVGLDKDNKTVSYLDVKEQTQTISYEHGEVKLNWRLDWPARWWLLGVDVEPFGRDHATKGGSYDTGEVLVHEIFGTHAPIPVPYEFINRVGETKKMSKSAGNVVTAVGLLDIMPPEIIWFFMLSNPPGRQLFFNESEALIKLFDDFAALQVKPDKSPGEQRLIELCLIGVDQPTVSNVPFSHLVASYQASLKNPDQTLDVIKRTEHAATADDQADTIRRELSFIDNWLERHAPESVKFSLLDQADEASFNEVERSFLSQLADKIATAPAEADGEWFHLRIYELKSELSLEPKAMFGTLYRALIGQESGPRAGWFLSQLDRDWLLKRLRLEA